MRSRFEIASAAMVPIAGRKSILIERSYSTTAQRLSFGRAGFSSHLSARTLKGSASICSARLTCFSPAGSSPRAMFATMVSASRRAFSKEIAGNGPTVIRRYLPSGWREYETLQDLSPAGVIRSISPLTSPSRSSYRLSDGRRVSTCRALVIRFCMVADIALIGDLHGSGVPVGIQKCTDCAAALQPSLDKQLIIYAYKTIFCVCGPLRTVYTPKCSLKA